MPNPLNPIARRFRDPTPRTHDPHAQPIIVHPGDYYPSTTPVVVERLPPLVFPTPPQARGAARYQPPQKQQPVHGVNDLNDMVKHLAYKIMTNKQPNPYAQPQIRGPRGFRGF